MKHYLNILQRAFELTLLMVLLVVTLPGEGPSPQDQEFRLAKLSGRYTFDFVSWEIRALGSKVVHGLLAPQRFMDEETRADFVLSYLANIDAARQLSSEIERIYVDPEVADPAVASAEVQVELAALRAAMAVQAPIAEAILGEQISQVLREAGFGAVQQILPPVSGSFTPLPYLLVISPRDHIEKIYQKELQAGLTAAEQEILEARIEEALPELSAYVTAIGGLSAYPAMLLEQGSIEWVADVMTHEWTHHYLLQAPLGWEYDTLPETRTINETTASLMGEWGGQEVVRRFYAPLWEWEKPLPETLVSPAQTDATGAPTEPRFDFRAEMRETRITVDALLEEGQIEAAERYMETRRQRFVEQGYRIRRLNQAYFAFHGAYASRPGAAGEDPVGPTVRQLWAVNVSPHAFLKEIKQITTLTALQSALETHVVP